MGHGKRIVGWNYIMQVASECGKLRLAGKHKEADLMQRELEDFVRSADGIFLGEIGDAGFRRWERKD